MVHRIDSSAEEASKANVCFFYELSRAGNAITKGYACKLPDGQRFVQSYFEFQIRISWKNKRRRMKSEERLNLKFTFRLKLKLVAINKIFSVASLTTDSSRILHEIGNSKFKPREKYYSGRDIYNNRTNFPFFVLFFMCCSMLPCVIMIALNAAFASVIIFISTQIYITFFIRYICSHSNEFNFIYI